MFSFFFSKKPEPSTETELPYLPDEMWALILGELHPVFLFEVMRVSQQLNKVARETVFKKIMWDYLPPGTPPVPTEDKAPDKHYKHFIAHFHGVPTSSAPRRVATGLITDINAGSWGRISTLRLVPSDLQYFVKCEDTSKKTHLVEVLSYVNAQNSQKLRDIVFSTLCKRQYMPTVLERVRSKSSIELDFELYLMAAGLNQAGFLRDYSPKRELPIVHEWVRPYPFLNLTIMYGHVESAIQLLKKYKWQWDDEPVYRQPDATIERSRLVQLGFEDPLVVCAWYNGSKIYRHLIQYCDNTIGPQGFYGALGAAVKRGSLEMITMLLEDYPDVRNMLKGESGIALLHDAIKTNNVEIVRILLTAGAIPSDEAKKIAGEANINPEILVLLNNPETPKPRGL